MNKNFSNPIYTNNGTHWIDGHKAALIVGLLILLFPCTGLARDFALGIGGGLSGVTNSEPIDRNSWWTAHIWVPIMENFVLEAGGGRGTNTAANDVERLTFRDVELGGTFMFLYEFSSLRMFIGGGGAWHRLTGSLKPIGIEASQNAVSRFGMQFIGGLEFELTNYLALFGAARYELVFNAELHRWIAYGGLHLRF